LDNKLYIAPIFYYCVMKTNLSLPILVTALFLSSAVRGQDTTGISSSEPAPFSPAATYRTWSAGVHGGALSPVLFYGKNDFTKWKADIGYGVYIKKQLLHSFALKANFLAGKLKGDNSKLMDNGQALNSPYSSFETSLKWSGALEGELTLANVNWLNRKSLIQPYVSAGIGYIGYNTTLTLAGSGGEQVTDDQEKLFVPVGAGLRFNVSPVVSVNVAYTMNFVDADDVDGYYYGPQNDKFSYANIGFEFALGPKSKPRLAVSNPVAAMQYDYMLKYKELSNELAAEKAKNSGIVESLKQEMNAFMNDADRDGVSDYFDKCQGTPEGVKVDGAGCPLPAAKNVTTIITEEDRRVVSEAIKNLEFDFGKATLRESSLPALEKVAELLIQKNFSLKLSGHTDDVGSADGNLRLSKARAESIKQFLVSKGANPSRIEATGYGKTQPIASNKTEEGRQQNRRVEFTLY